MIDSKSSVTRLQKIQDIFCLGKGQELVKERNLCLLRIALAGDLEGEAEIWKAGKCLTIILDPEMLQEAHLYDNSFTVVMASRQEKNVVENVEEFSPVSVASFKSLPRTLGWLEGQAKKDVSREDNLGQDF